VKRSFISSSVNKYDGDGFIVNGLSMVEAGLTRVISLSMRKL